MSAFSFVPRASKPSPASHKRFITNTKDQTRLPKNHAKLLPLSIPVRKSVGPSIRQSVRPCLPASSPKRQAQKRLSVFLFFLSSVSQDRLLISPMISGRLLVGLALVVLDGVFKQLSSSQVLLCAFLWVLRLLAL